MIRAQLHIKGHIYKGFPDGSLGVKKNQKNLRIYPDVILYAYHMKQIEAAFESVIGQREIVQNRILAHSAFAQGCDAPMNVLFTGEAGLGKTHLLRAEQKARRAACEIRYGRPAEVLFMRSPQEIRLASPQYFDFIEHVGEGDGTVIDELHEIDISTTVQLKTLRAILKALMDNGAGNMRAIQLSDDNVISRPKEEIFFAAGTNFPQKIKDGAAIISRFGGELPLSLYNEEELTKILLAMAEDNGLRINENTVSLIARCGRGTARPLEKIIGHLVQMAHVAGKHTINRTEALDAMRSLSLYPFGVSKREVSIMVKAKGAGVRVRDLPILFAVEPKSVNQSLSFLAIPGYIQLKGGVVQLAQAGNLYLEQLKAEKFHVPA